MQLDSDKLITILLCALVTFIPRVLPFILVNQLKLPDAISRALKYIPVCLFTSIVMSMLIQSAEDESGQSYLEIHWDMIAACIPTCIVSYWTRSLAKSVITGVLMLYLIHLFF